MFVAKPPLCLLPSDKGLLGHVHKRLLEVLLAEGKLGLRPNFGVLYAARLDESAHAITSRVPDDSYRLEGLLDLDVEASSLESDDLGSTLRVVGDGRAAL